MSEPDPKGPDMTVEWASHAKEHDLLISGLVFHQYCKKRGVSHDDEGVLMRMSEFFKMIGPGRKEKPAFKMMNEICPERLQCNKRVWPDQRFVGFP